MSDFEPYSSRQASGRVRPATFFRVIQLAAGAMTDSLAGM